MNKEVKITSSNGITTLTSDIGIEATQNEVWEVLKFPGKVREFHPLIKNSFMTTPNQNGIGAKRHCDLLPMGAMDEVITEWEEGKSITIEVTGGKMLPPHHFMKGRFVLESRGQYTLVTFSFSYKLKFGPLGKIMDVLFIRSQFKKAPPQYVEGLKAYVEER